MSEIAYNLTQTLLRTTQLQPARLGLHFYADALFINKLDTCQFIKNNKSYYYRLLNFMAAKLGSVFELIGQTWVQRFDWTLKDELVIFSTQPKGDILLIPITAFSSLFVNNTEVVRPIWLNATDKAQYRNIQIYGASVGLTATGPWSESMYITALPTKFYVRKPLPTANQFSELCVAFEVY